MYSAPIFHIPMPNLFPDPNPVSSRGLMMPPMHSIRYIQPNGAPAYPHPLVHPAYVGGVHPYIAQLAAFIAHHHPRG